MIFNTSKNKRDLYYHLWLMLKSGLTISDALYSCPVAEYQKKCSLWAHAILSGKSTFSDVLQQEYSFNEYDCYIIEMAEKTGNFEEVFENLYQHYDHKIQIKNALISKMMYPCFLIFMTGIGYNIPSFISDFSMNKLLANLFWFYFPFVFMGVFSFYGLPRLLSMDNNFGKILESMIFRLPIIGKCFLSGTVARCMFPLEMFFRCGLGITEGFELVMKSTASPNFRNDLRKIIAKSHQGLPLQTLLKELKWLDHFSYSMIITGEVSGKIPECLHRIYEQKIEESRVSTFALISIFAIITLLTACLVAAYQILTGHLFN